SGLLELQSPGAPLVERSVRVPPHLVLALAGVAAPRDGCSLDAHDDEVPLPPSVLEQARRHARSLAREPGRALVIRAGAVREGRAVARAVAVSLGLEPVFVVSDDVKGLAPWLHVSGRLPVFERQLGPGECFHVPSVSRYTGPVLVATG